MVGVAAALIPGGAEAEAAGAAAEGGAAATEEGAATEAGASEGSATSSPSGAPEKPSGVPDHWSAEPTKKGGGTKYSDPTNPHNTVRSMPGNPRSPNPAQRGPYVKENVSGQPINKYGQPVRGDSPESHIPADEYQYRGTVEPDE